MLRESEYIVIMLKQAFQKIFPAFLLIILFFVSLFVYSRLFGPIPFSVRSVTTNKNDVFSVSGEGKAVVKPDIALVSVGIEASGATVKQIQNQINQTINQVTAALKKLGIEEKDIKTTNYSINPTYDWTSGRQRITGYHASTNLSIKVRDIDKTNEVIDISTANGANQVGTIAFDVDDKTKAEEEARKQAVEEAKKKAAEAARIAGFKLGRIINYQEGRNELPQPILLRESAKVGMGGGAPTEVQPGSSEIKMVVTLSYELE
jgi:hypothetical protein